MPYVYVKIEKEVAKEEQNLTKIKEGYIKLKITSNKEKKKKVIKN